MAFIYISEQGAVVKRAGQRLIVAKDHDKLLDIPVSKVEGVLIFGNVQFTTQAVRLMLQQGVEMALFTSRGRLLGQLTSPATKNIALREAQYARHGDAEFVLRLARTFVAGKVANALAFVREFGHNHPDVDLTEPVSRIEASLHGIEAQTDLASLLGLEGAAARCYFQGFAQMLRRDLQFTGRRRRPAPDPVNALLSLGYTLAYGEIGSFLDGMGFDPYLGFYHQPRHGHATLASDLLEEFRTPLVDRFTLYLVNNRIFKAEDFFLHQPSGGMHLRAGADKRYFAEYERFVARPTQADGTGPSFRRLFRIQAELLRKAIVDGQPYTPYRFSW